MSASSSLVEELTIQPVPADRRTGRVRHLFSVWFGVQIMPLTLITGVLGPTVFGLDLLSTIASVVVGNLVGAIFMALHSVQGPKLGVPQMIQARAQFGMYGSLISLVVVILMYLGFLASIVALAQQTLLQLVPALNPTVALLLCSAVTLVAVVFGYEFIHRVNRVLMVFFGAAVVLLAVFTLSKVNPLTIAHVEGHASLIGFIGMASVAATWQIAYAPYVSDYSRYLPTDTEPKRAFWYTFAGAVVGAVPMMLLGALVIFAVGGTGSMAEIASVMPAPVAGFVLVMLLLGALDAAVMNLYGPALCTLTFVQTFRSKWNPGPTARNVVAIVIAVLATIIALLFADNFLVNFSNFIHLLMCFLIPWSVVNLVDYYLLAHGDYDVEAFTDSTRGYGAVNVPALTTYVVGFLVQLPFTASGFYNGFVATALDGVDISWLVGSIVSFGLYFALTRTRTAGSRLLPEHTAAE